MYCCDWVDEEVLVIVRLYGMLVDYDIFLENLSFTSFSRLIGKLPGKLTSHKKALKPSPQVVGSQFYDQATTEKEAIVAAFEKGMERGIRTRRGLLINRNKNHF